MKEKIHKAITEYPQEVEHMLLEWYKKMPEQAEQGIDEIIYGCHLATEALYNHYINKLSSVKWSLAEVINVARIDFDAQEYYIYDFAFLMNYLYILFHDRITDCSYYVFMAKSMLENPLMDEPDDIAYHLAKKISL